MTTTQKRWTRSGLAVVSALLLAGCSGAPAPSSTAEPGSAAGADSASQAEAEAYECNGRFIDPETYHAGVRADRLPEADAAGIAAAVEDVGGAAMDGDLSAWIIAVQATDSVTMLHPLEAEGDYEVVIVDRMDELPATGEPGWILTSSASCTLALDPSPLTSAEVALDPAAAPDADSTRLALLVTERDCNSGRDAEGRIEVVSLEETEDAVLIRVAVRPHEGEGAFTCQSNPPTPFTVELSEPLGDRELLDGSLVIPQPIPVQPELGL
ncbi:hypothetical protein [Microbacterium sp. NPDC056234]|uniref:hypothetical protein n=1 Tax=Microbacterium sp. NPDC056234 TaxID=3345757 RepID=UPI0035D66F17